MSLSFFPFLKTCLDTKFVCSTDAQRVLQQGHFTLEEARVTVTEMMADDNTKHQITGSC